nr:uncharacterized protein LOC111768009 [Equus caballus]
MAGGALRGPHGEWEPRPAPGSPGGHNRPAPRCGRCRRFPHAAAAAADDDDRPQPSPPPAARRRAEPRSHPQGEENARSPSLGLKLQHGFRLRRSSPSPYSGSSTLLPLFPAPARLRSRDPGGSAPSPRAAGSVRAPAPRASPAGSGGPGMPDPGRRGFPGSRPAPDRSRAMPEKEQEDSSDSTGGGSLP